LTGLCSRRNSGEGARRGDKRTVDTNDFSHIDDSTIARWLSFKVMGQRADFARDGSQMWSCVCEGRWWGIWYVQGKEDCCRLINLWVALFIRAKRGELHAIYNDALDP